MIHHGDCLEVMAAMEPESVDAIVRRKARRRTGHLLLTGGGDWERYTFAGACNEPVPHNWKNACRRRAGHLGPHHYWDARTGTNKGRHPFPFRDEQGKPIPTVYVWGLNTRPNMNGEARMLRGHGAYIAPIETDRLMVEAIKSRESDWRGATA